MAIVNNANSGKILKENAFRSLYGANFDGKTVEDRYTLLEKRFTECFHHGNSDLFSASGRIEICGNHTDHNNGKVLVAAISVDTLAAVSKTEDNIIRVASEGYRDMVIDVASLKKVPEENGTSIALVKGVVQGLMDRGYRVGGFQAAITSNVFKGAGVSSSASFELLMCEILNVYYNNGAISKVEKAQISQFAENEFFGKPCGLLDQAGISLGGLSYIDFKDPEHPVTGTLTPNFEGYDIVLVNTGGDHSDLTHCYASIRVEMGEVAKCFGKSVLREVDEAEFYASLPALKNKVSGRAILRAIHFYEENKRIDRCLAALEKNDLKSFFAAINASGDSSYRLLQNCYVEGDVKQPIPLAIAVTRRILGGDGAVRVHGGGFAGTILTFVNRNNTEQYISEMKKLFGEQNVFKTTVRSLGACKVNE